MKNNIKPELRIVKIQRPLFSSDGSNECLLYAVDPITLERLEPPCQKVFSNEMIEELFEVADNSFDKIYMLAYCERDKTTFIDGVLLDEWE